MGDREDTVRHRLCQLCRCSPNSFPGAHPVSVDKGCGGVGGPGTEDCWASSKTDGDRRLLYFDPVTGTAFAVDRLLRLQEHSCKAHPLLFAGTVFDCELVHSSGERVTFVVFDVLAFAGSSVQRLGFMDRLRHARDHLSTVSGDFDVRMKPFFRVSDTLGMYWFQAYCEAPSTPTHSDGVVIIDAGAEYHPGRHWGFRKWKPPHQQTVDFIVGEDGLGRLGDCDVAVQLKPLPDHPGVWECSMLQLQPPVWRPLKHRPDKDKSNDRTSYLRTLSALGEGRVTLADIFCAQPFTWSAVDAAVDAVWQAYQKYHGGLGSLELEFRIGRLDKVGGRWRVGVTQSQHQHLHAVLGRALPADNHECSDTLMAAGRRSRVFADGTREECSKISLLTHTMTVGSHAVRLCLCAEVPGGQTAAPTRKAATSATSAKVVEKVCTTYHLRDFYLVLAHRQEVRASGRSSSYQVEVEWRQSTAPDTRLEAVRAVTSGLMKVAEVVRHLTD